MWIVALVSLIAAALTLFSGFGLGSLLFPAFALLFPAQVAVAATAVVHLLNNLFKAALLGRYAVWRVVLIFALPGAVTSLLGALLLVNLSRLEALGSWELGGRTFSTTPLGLTLGGLILVFAALELHPKGRRVALPPRYLPLGGALSGFLGGLSGHQGALRSAFLVRLGLEKRAFLGTSTLCAVVIDVARLCVYGLRIFSSEGLRDARASILAGTLAAFLGSYFGVRMIGKTTMEGIRKLVGVLLVALGLALAGGLLDS
jgi:hypothetical protein